MASSIVKSVAQQLGNLLVEEAKSLYKVRDKIESLQMELKFMECFLRDADSQQHQEEVVCLWVSQIRDLSYDAEDTIERYLHGVSRHRRDGIWNAIKWFSSIPFNGDCWTMHNLGSDIDNLTVRMAELTSRLRMYGIQIIKPTKGLEYNPMIREKMRTHSHTEEDVVGLVKETQLLVDQLVKEINVHVVGISGTGGLGKTTLARKVFKHNDIKDHFKDACVWIYVSKEFETVKIFQDILFGLEKGGEVQTIRELPVEELLTKIHELLQKKRCLVVLDDIWYQRSWKRLKPAFEPIIKSSSASKILLTTRTQDLLQQVDPCGYLHLQQPLSDDESWKLLKQKAFLAHETKDDDQVKFEMEKLGKEMLKHCDGLPIAIVAVGGILSTKKTLSEWEDVQTNITSYLMSGMEQEGTSSRILEILELSYNELPFYLKPCFLYLGNFPEDYEISTQRLYHLWAAEGFLAIDGEDKKKGGTSYDIGERYLNDLVQRSMVQMIDYWASGRIKTCQVHDVMRDMCLRKCEEVSFLSHVECTESGMVSVLPPFSVENKKLRRCAVHGESKLYGDEEFQLGEKAIGLRSLLVLTEGRKPARNTWKSIPLLRVLDLEGALVYSPYLNEMKYLIHLRYLSLKDIRTRELPSCLFDLQYLEILDLRVDGFRGAIMMVRNKFWKMKRLRHLYLPSRFIVEGDERLTFPVDGKMETIKNFDPKRCEMKGLIQMINLRVFSITKRYIFEKVEELKGVMEAPVMKKAGQLINSFKIGIHEDVIRKDPRVLSSATCNTNFKELIIKGAQRLENDGNKGDGVIFPKSLKRVELKECEIEEEGDLLLALEKLPGLQVLEISESGLGGEEGGNKLSLTPGSFPQLRELSIIDPKGSVFEWEVGEAAAASLQIFMIKGCEKGIKLNNVPNSLTEVELWDCGITDGKISALEKLPHLKSLRLEIHICNKLSFSPGSFSELIELHLRWETELYGEWEVGEGALPNLQSLEVIRLNKVINKLPDNLTEVDLFDCDIFGEGEYSLFGCLEKLPYLQLLDMSRKSGCTRGSGCKKLTFSPGSFPQLTELIVSHFYDLEEWEVGEDSLPHLQRLDVFGGFENKLKKVNKLPNSLTQVELTSCELVEGGDSLLACLERLSRLQLLILKATTVSLNGGKMSFPPDSFPQLTQLTLTSLSELEEWEVGEGSLSNLQRLYLTGCKNLKKLPQRLPASVQIECQNPCIKGIQTTTPALTSKKVLCN